MGQDEQVEVIERAWNPFMLIGSLCWKFNEQPPNSFQTHNILEYYRVERLDPIHASA
jgi:hypothetical protein